MDATVVVDVPAARDVRVDRITIVDTGAPDLVVTVPCTVANNNCPDGFYCQSANCTTGVCTAAPASSDETPGMRLRSPDLLEHVDRGGQRRLRPHHRRLPERHRLQRQHHVDCPMPALCNLEQATAADCNLNNPAGRCWVLPDTCPPQAAGAMPTTRRCNTNNACQSRCTLVANARTFFVDPTCP